MTSPIKSIAISRVGQIAINVHDLDRATAFYRDILGLPLLFKAGSLVFFNCGGVRLMLTRPEKPEFDHPGSVLYFAVPDIILAHRQMLRSGVRFEDEPHLIAKMPTHNLWMTFFRDSEENLLALRCELPLASGTTMHPSSKNQSAAGRALDGIRILVGRARHQASTLSSHLRQLGAEVLEIPFIEIRKPHSYRPLDTALKRISEYDWLILTSVNGADAFWERLHKLGFDSNRLKHLKVAAIGPATARAIERHGLQVNVVPKQYVAESVVASLRRKVQGKRVLLARARLARDVIPRELTKLTARVDVVEVYQTIIPRSSRKKLIAALNDADRRPHIITFTSSSTVKNFVALLGEAPRQLEDVSLASIGPVTSSTLRQLGLPVHIEADEYTIPGLVDAIVRHTRGH